MLKQLIKKSRSYRRFYGDKNIFPETLRGLIDFARLSPSAANLQPLKYMISYTPETNSLVFDSLSWAGYLKEWKCPPEGERPSGYIIILSDIKIKKHNDIDAGIASQSIMLGAAEKGLGGCIFGSIKRKELKTVLKIPETLEIVLILALGYPKEKVVIEEISRNESIKYWREPDGTHHVPKRKLDDIILSDNN